MIREDGCTNARRIGRGKTTGLSIAKKRRKGATGKLHVIIPADKIVAVGPRTVNFMTEISIIVQQHPPFNVQKWKGVHDVVKERIVMKVMRDPMTQKKPNFQDLWQITHTRKGEWVDETSKEVHGGLSSIAKNNESTLGDKVEATE
ncbi:hypothetical protein glysoja_037270 [Glycine soja]|uniref:Uncharacterized protein n=1 Tax=Glycine soja TaxID=3848 RepID=A0A0B2RMY1_GLYSO|nr:hypothetical protein glysoja_037270 [Glycine soja]